MYLFSCFLFFFFFFLLYVNMFICESDPEEIRQVFCFGISASELLKHGFSLVSRISFK